MGWLDSLFKGIGSLVPQLTTPSTPSTPSTNYSPGVPSGGSGVPAPSYSQGNPYNEILYSKNLFEGSGASSGTQDWARNNANQYYDQLGSDAGRVRDMNASQLSDWMNSQNQQKTAPTTQPTTKVPDTINKNPGYPATSSGYYFNPGSAMSNAPQIPKPAVDPIPVRDRSAIQKYVEAQIQRKLNDAKLSRDQAVQAGKTQAGQYKTTVNNQLTGAISRLTEGARQATTGVQTGYDRMNQQEGEERTLADTALQHQLNPFSGRSDYARGLIGRERALTDRQQGEDLQSRLGNINQELSNNKGTAELDAQARLAKIDEDMNQMETQLAQKYQALESAAPDERQALIASIEKDEREYQMALRGENRSDIMANSQLTQQAFDQQLQQFNANRGVYESDRNFNWDQNKFQQEMDWNQWMGHTDAAQRLGEQYGIPVYPTNSGQGLFDQIAGKKPLNQQEFEWQKQYQQGQLENSKNQAGNDTSLAKEKFAWEKEQARLGKAVNPYGFQEYLDKSFKITNPYTGEITYRPGLREAIVDIGLSDADTDRLLSLYGMSPN